MRTAWRLESCVYEVFYCLRRNPLFSDTSAESLAGTHTCPIVLISVIDIRFLTLPAGVSFIFRHTRKLDGLADLTYAAALDLKPIRWIL